MTEQTRMTVLANTKRSMTVQRTRLTFWNGLQYGNYSREDSSLNVTVDIDTNCELDTTPVMVYYDVGHLKVVDNETVWNGYMYNN